MNRAFLLMVLTESIMSAYLTVMSRGHPPASVPGDGLSVLKARNLRAQIAGRCGEPGTDGKKGGLVRLVEPRAGPIRHAGADQYPGEATAALPFFPLMVDNKVSSKVR